MTTNSLKQPPPRASSKTLNNNQTIELQYLIQDPSIDLFNAKYTILDSIKFNRNIDNGPEDSDIKIAGKSAIKKENGKFRWFENIKETEADQEKVFDSIHTFTVARLVLDTYIKLFTHINVDIGDLNEEGEFDFMKKWNGPLTIYPNAFEKITSIYTPIDNFIDLGYSDDKKVCRSFDVIAHEVGHAIFQAIRYPIGTTYNQMHTSPEMDEAFADLTAVFTLLGRKKICRMVLDQTEFDLRSPKNFIPRIGEILADHDDCYKTSSVRNISDAYNNLQSIIQQINVDPHTSSTILSGAIYEFILRLFKRKKDEIVKSLATEFREDRIRILGSELHEIGRSVSVIVTNAFYNKRKSHILNMNIIGQEMLDIMHSNNRSYFKVFKKVFKDFNYFKLSRN